MQGAALHASMAFAGLQWAAGAAQTPSAPASAHAEL